MMGKTHMAVGAAVSIAMLGTLNPAIIPYGIATAAIGAALPDIDSKNSIAKREFTGTVFIILALMILAPAISKVIGVNLVGKLASNTALIGAAIISGIYGVIGVQSNHRGFTHSMEGTILATLPIAIALPAIAPWFAIGYATHPLLDLLNKKGVQLTIFSKKRFCLGWCSADGGMNLLIRYIAIAAILLQIFIIYG